MADSAPHDLPLSFGQEQLWFLDRLRPGNSVYSVAVALRIRGDLDVEALRRAFDEIVRRHDTLRARFPDRAGVPVCVPADSADLPLSFTDLGGLPEDRRESEAERLLSEEADAPFDLVSGPLIRLRLVRLSGEDHALAVTAHQIVLDSASMEVLLRELGQVYAAFRDGRPPVLPTPSPRYADYAREQRGRSYAASLEYWRKRLDGVPAMLRLPCDRRRPAVRSGRGAAQIFELGQELTARLTGFSDSRGTTVATTVLAAFKTLLAHYCDQRDITVGTILPNRPQGEPDSAIGHFANTVVLRSDLSGARLEPGFGEVVRRVDAAVREARVHGDVPFEELIRILQPERDPSSTPLFQVLFRGSEGHEEAEEAEEAPEFARLAVERIDLPRTSARFDLTLAVRHLGEKLVCELEYSTDLFEPATIRRMAGHLRQLLEDALANPDRPVSALRLLLPAEREQILTGWNDTGSARGEPRCLHTLFEEQVRRTPEALAVVWRDQRLTYRQLDERANQMAHALRSRGVGAETGVGICLERSAATLVALLAVFKAGGTFIPLDPDYPAERLAFMLSDSKASLLISDATTAAALTGADAVPVLLIDRDDPEIRSQPTLPPVTGVLPSNLAGMLYTSGSTGTPKCAMLTHANFVNYFHSFEERYDLSRRLRAHVQMASFSFDMFMGDTMRALFTGATLVVCPREVSLSPPELLDLMLQEGVNSAEFVPPLLRVFLDHVEASGESLEFLDFLMAGGDVWYVRDFERARRLCHPGTVMAGTYGLTESTIDNTHFAEGHPGDDPDGALPVGRPLPGSRIYILNSALQPVPPGVAGELYVGGDGVGRGYFGRTDLTATRFVPDPFSGVPGARLYRSGDLTRYRPDGTIEIVGRSDHQVKVRGFRVELGEVGEALRGHPDVEDVLVIVHDKAPGDRHLVAYASVAAGRWPTSDETRLTWERETRARLRDHLRGRLPGFMIPSAIVLLESMPLNSNGKLNRRGLPSPEQELSAQVGGGAEPRTPAEEIIGGIWSALIGVGSIGLGGIGVHDNFFSIGGHSLLATQVLARIRTDLRAELPVRAIYESPTIAGLAERAEASLRSGTPTTPPIVPLPRVAGQRLPLSFAQRRLWFIDQLEPGSPAYNIASPLRLRGALDREALRRSLEAMVERHEVLRTVFGSDDGEPWQEIRPVPSWELALTDLSGLGSDERTREAERLVGEEAMRPFDLVRGPLMRTELLRLAADEHILLLTMHHLVTDGWSGSVFFEDLAALYAAGGRQERAGLAELPVCYADYAVWQRDWLRDGVLAHQLVYWKERLASAPTAIELPFDRPREAAGSSAGRVVEFRVPADVLDGIRAVSQAGSATVFITLLTAFHCLMGRLSGQDDIVVAVPTAARGRTELDRLVGFFVNTLALRADLSGNPTFRSLLDQVRRVALDGYAHQDVPFEKIVEELNPDRSPWHNPLAQVLFVLQNNAPETAELTGLDVEPVPFDVSTSQFDLGMQLWETDSGLQGMLSYRTELFDEDTAERITSLWGTLLHSVAAAPDTRLSDLPLSATRPLTAPPTGAELPPPPIADGQTADGQTVISRFEAQVRRTPDRIAVVYGATELTYAELGERVDQMASALREAGVGPELTVAVALPRSAHLVIATLAVLRAGGCCLPLDPGTPHDRLELLPADCPPVLTVTDRAHAWFLPADLPTLVIGEPGPATPPDVRTPPPQPAGAACVVRAASAHGEPLGAVLSHQDVLRVITGAGPCPGFGDVFDFTVWEWWGQLLRGGRVTVTSRRSAGQVADTYPSADRPPAYVLDGAGRRLPPGVVGELYLSGPGPARGYPGRPARTAERFVADPYGPPGGRMYRTGARARLRGDGSVDLVGRAGQGESAAASALPIMADGPGDSIAG
ncbi:amino acid adenylation domain-containing protein [Streptomyces sp. NPDC059679]|uniref:amino acid adenylation domain-containing protein n=1 Tax=Streptomyces sp. NPDC059679 TaxID=3346903 RepID=UPI0036A443E8